MDFISRQLLASGVFIAPPGEQVYTTPGAHIWTVPAGVTSVCVVCVSGGGGGGGYGHRWCGGSGGGLAYKNDFSVLPGQLISVEVGAGGAGDPAGSY